MKKTAYRTLGVAALTMTLGLQPPAIHAEIVTTGQLTAQHVTDVERATIQSFLDRANVRHKIQAMGIDGLLARDRVAALSDEEVHVLAARIDSLPTGGNFANFTNDQLIIVLLIAILVAVVVSA
jgi:DNA-binding transcriptional regulator YdaS (Cro superfamily)